jgi:hypothetical protein
VHHTTQPRIATAQQQHGARTGGVLRARACDDAAALCVGHVAFHRRKLRRLPLLLRRRLRRAQCHA